MPQVPPGKHVQHRPPHRLLLWQTNVELRHRNRLRPALLAHTRCQAASLPSCESVQPCPCHPPSCAACRPLPIWPPGPRPQPGRSAWGTPSTKALQAEWSSCSASAGTVVHVNPCSRPPQLSSQALADLRTAYVLNGRGRAPRLVHVTVSKSWCLAFRQSHATYRLLAVTTEQTKPFCARILASTRRSLSRSEHQVTPNPKYPTHAA